MADKISINRFSLMTLLTQKKHFKSLIKKAFQSHWRALSKWFRWTIYRWNANRDI